MSSPNKYQPPVNMPERVAAAYWQGALTRQEAQKVFDEYGAAIQGLGKAMAQLDMSMAYLAEKFGIKPEDVTNWIAEKATQAEEKPIIAASA